MGLSHAYADTDARRNSHKLKEVCGGLELELEVQNRRTIYCQQRSIVEQDSLTIIFNTQRYRRIIPIVAVWSCVFYASFRQS
jgi:hypothetical protein